MYSTKTTYYYTYASINNDNNKPTNNPSKIYSNILTFGSLIQLNDIPTANPFQIYPPAIPKINETCNCHIERNNNYNLIVATLVTSTIGTFFIFILMVYKFYYKKKYPKRRPLTNNPNFGTIYNSNF